MLCAFVFPGQGSQSVGMLKQLAAAYPEINATFACASEVLHYDLWRIVQEGPAAELDQTIITQPALLAAGVAIWRVWQRRGGRMPSYLAGHSLGEYTALVCAGALCLEDAIKLVVKRGRYMQEATPEGQGAMAAILGLSKDDVTEVCRDASQGEVVSAVNFNSPGQIVIAGSVAAVDRALEMAKAKGAKRTVLLPVSVPSHCELMRPAAKHLAAYLEGVEVSVPQIPILHNVDVNCHTDITAIRHALVCQLHQPVRWVETIETLAQSGVEIIVECGPGKVLTGLNKRVARSMITLSIHNPESMEEALITVASKETGKQ